MFHYVRNATILLLFGMSAASSAHAAAVLFSNLVQPGDRYGFDAIGIGHTPGFIGPDGITVAATRFSVAFDSRLEQFQVPVDVRTGPNEIHAFLLADDAGSPGAVIESFAFAGPQSMPILTPLTTVSSAASPLLRAGAPYWFAFTSTNETFAGWTLTLFQGNSSGSANFAVRSVVGGVPSDWAVGTGGPGAREGTLVVLGSPVPEPASALPIAAGALLLFGYRKGSSFTA